MRRFTAPLVVGALVVAVALPAGARTRDAQTAHCGQTRDGFEVIFDGSKRCFDRWRYAGGATMTLQKEGTVRSGPGGSSRPCSGEIALAIASS